MENLSSLRRRSERHRFRRGRDADQHGGPNHVSKQHPLQGRTEQEPRVEAEKHFSTPHSCASDCGKNVLGGTRSHHFSPPAHPEYRSGTGHTDHRSAPELPSMSAGTIIPCIGLVSITDRLGKKTTLCRKANSPRQLLVCGSFLLLSRPTPKRLLSLFHVFVFPFLLAHRERWWPLLCFAAKGQGNVSTTWPTRPRRTTRNPPEKLQQTRRQDEDDDESPRPMRRTRRTL